MIERKRLDPDQEKNVRFAQLAQRLHTELGHYPLLDKLSSSQKQASVEAGTDIAEIILRMEPMADDERLFEIMKFSVLSGLEIRMNNVMEN